MTPPATGDLIIRPVSLDGRIVNFKNNDSVELFLQYLNVSLCFRVYTSSVFRARISHDPVLGLEPCAGGLCMHVVFECNETYL